MVEYLPFLSTISLPFMCVDIGTGIVLWNEKKELPFHVETWDIDFEKTTVPDIPDEGMIIHAEGYLHSDGNGIRAVRVWVDEPPVMEGKL